MFIAKKYPSAHPKQTIRAEILGLRPKSLPENLGAGSSPISTRKNLRLRTAPCYPTPPRCGAVGYTWQYGPSATANPS